jgi:hypothetical protein
MPGCAHRWHRFSGNRSLLNACRRFTKRSIGLCFHFERITWYEAWPPQQFHFTVVDTFDGILGLSGGPR